MDSPAQEQRKMVKAAPRSFLRRRWTQLDIYIASALFIVHFVCIFAPFHFNWAAFWVSFGLYTITGLSISVSYHRNLAHKSFKLPKLLEYFFAYCAAHALQGDPIDWVSTHRCHHQFVDTERDPHSPVQGFWFSHIAWLFDSYSLTKRVCPKYFTTFQKVERSLIVWFSKHGRPDNVGDLEKQMFYRFIHKTYLLHIIALAVLLFKLGGLPFFIWGMCVRMVVLFHVTFMVNSVCHVWGKQQWNTQDLSRNNWWNSTTILEWDYGLLAFGEGWHNNHHAFEYSARHGLEWWQIDFGWYVIKFLRAIGVATNVKLPSQNHKQRLAIHKPQIPSNQTLT